MAEWGVWVLQGGEGRETRLKTVPWGRRPLTASSRSPLCWPWASSAGGGDESRISVRWTEGSGGVR